MRRYHFLLILPLLGWSFTANAQVFKEAAMPEQWQLTVDVIKAKAQSLLVENNGLQLQHRELMAQTQQLQEAISQQQARNDQFSQRLKERHGLTDQQLRIEELTQLTRSKKQKNREFNEQLEDLKKKKADLDQKISQLKYTISGVELQQSAKANAPVIQGPDDNQLNQWRRQLEDENKKEVLLEHQVEDLQTGDKAQDLNVQAVEKENKHLEARLDVLRLRKLQHIKESSDTAQAQTNARTYDQLRKRKEQLEHSINAYEVRLDQLKKDSMQAMSWPLKKKKLVHQMVQADSRNNQMRGKIKDLREDIDVLREQVGRLERRVNFVQGKDLTK